MKLRKVLKRSIITATILVVGGSIGYGLRVWQGPARTVVKDAPPLTVNVATLQHPVTIPAQQSRSYIGGSIHIEEDYGEQGGYRLSRVSYPSDGLRIFALMATPSTPKPVFGYPAVIVVHGYTNPALYRTNGPEYAAYIAAFARRGYVVIKPDLRGHDQSWGVAPGAYYTPDYAADVLNLAASLQSYTPVDGGMVGLFGHSMGGYVALEAATARPQRFRAASLAAPAAGDLTDMFYHWQPRSEAETPAAQAARRRLVQLFGEPNQNSQFWRSVSPLNYVAGLTTAIQLHHGLADTVVPPRFSTELNVALAQSNRSVELYTYPGVGHTPTGTTQGQIVERSLALYDRYLHR